MPPGTSDCTTLLLLTVYRASPRTQPPAVFPLHLTVIYTHSHTFELYLSGFSSVSVQLKLVLSSTGCVCGNRCNNTHESMCCQCTFCVYTVCVIIVFSQCLILCSKEIISEIRSNVFVNPKKHNRFLCVKSHF